MNIAQIMQANISESNTEWPMPPELPEAVIDFIAMRQLYGAAIKEIRTKLEILDDEFHVKFDHNPIHHMEYRLKSPKSIADKLRKKQLEFNMESVRENLTDIAGVRVICNYLDDIYHIARLLVKQDDITLVRTRDYIKNPKPNGYRSFHVIIAVPVYYLDTMEYFPVEIQLRTMTMDLWASMEHRVCYKKLPEHRDELAEAFCQYADILGKIEEQFEAYNETGMLEEITPAQITENPTEG